jgi:hypothetical protein
LLFVISAFCHIGFLFYRLIDIGFLTVGLFRSAFDLESIATMVTPSSGVYSPSRSSPICTTQRNTCLAKWVDGDIGTNRQMPSSSTLTAMSI